MSLLEGYRLFTGYYIYESEMPSEQKLEFVKFLKEASSDDIIDILSGQYEGVASLSEDEMVALNTYIEEKFGAKFLAKAAEKAKGAAVAGAGKVKGAGKAAYGKTFHTAMGRTALAGGGGVAAGAGGMAAYKKGKKK